MPCAALLSVLNDHCSRLFSNHHLPSSVTTAEQHTLHTTHHTSHIIHHTSHIIHHTSCITHHTSRIKHHTSRITHHTSRITHHTSRITNHTSRITNHTSRITHHTSHAPLARACCRWSASALWTHLPHAAAALPKRASAGQRQQRDLTAVRKGIARRTWRVTQAPPPLPLGARITVCYAHFGSSNRVINGQCHETAGVIRSNTVV
jgi:hypothetical protein